MPARTVIHDAFEEHIVHAPGMVRIGEIVNGRILPTPGAVLLAAERLAEELGDLVVIDVGGATTDVHSITDGSPEIGAIQIEPKPHSRRTVEGDLGTFVSAEHVAAMMPAGERPAALPPALPRTEPEVGAARALAAFCTVAGVRRHAGRLTHLYTPTGRQTVARGRDLTACRLLVGTGGALTRLPGGDRDARGRSSPQDGRRRSPAAAGRRELRARRRLRPGRLRRPACALRRGRRGGPHAGEPGRLTESRRPEGRLGRALRR